MATNATTLDATRGSTSGATGRSRGKPSYRVKVFIVLQKNFVRDRHISNTRIIATKLTLAAAERVKDEQAGRWIETRYADKD